MSFETLLVNVCTVIRYIAGAQDTYGNPSKPWINHLIDQPCRISYPRGQQVQRGTEVVPVDAVLFMEDIDVIEHDRVIVDSTTFEILFVAQLQDGITSHHKELSLKRIIP